ncbi:hypothetical protein V7x_49760 [Crateriforma conspicua]|uniref:Uncharacterized protein n=1 Tax=Crateriforma conspicua TaxID=2527996 RepID=A0A5C6FRW6_9PLAN|nr:MULTISPECIES: hypothetical protein [Crateriforma]TWU63236.1 hypothetical protein V7x_49760 [Crateriforma conspicua]
MTDSHVTTIDEAFIQRVAQLVIRRLAQMQLANMTAPVADAARPAPPPQASCDEKVVTDEAVAGRPVGTTLVIRSDAIVTPLAKDTARQRQIRLVRGDQPDGNKAKATS